jgi:hypothetical protein
MPQSLMISYRMLCALRRKIDRFVKITGPILVLAGIKFAAFMVVAGLWLMQLRK